MVEPVGREYNRGISADDALCEASHLELRSSLAAASRLDDWILNGSGFVSEPRYPAELFSDASAAGAEVRPRVERVVVSNAEVDNLIRGLAAARHAVSAEAFHRFVSKNAAALSELLYPFGYQGCRLTAQASIDDFDRAYSSWSAMNAEKVGSMPSVDLPPERGSVPEEDAAARQRMWHAAATDPMAAAFIGAGALVSATVGRLFGFEQAPHRAAAGGQTTSILVHTAGGTGANRATGSERAPIGTEAGRATQRSGARRLDGASSLLVSRGGLIAHEAAGGHLLARHVGQSRIELEARLAAEPALEAASTFVSRAEAEAAISSVLAQRSAEIQVWVASGAKGIRPFEGAFTGGSVLRREAFDTVEGSRARVVLSGNGRGDFIILTGFPLP